MLNDAIRKLRKIRRFSPFFLNKTIDEIIKDIEDGTPVPCYKCGSSKVGDDGVLWCRLYRCAKPWDGYCEKGKVR